jgi:hypothetical protein
VLGIDADIHHIEVWNEQIEMTMAENKNLTFIAHKIN